MLLSKNTEASTENIKNRKIAEDLIFFLEEKKLNDILLLNIQKVNPYFCFFIFATASSTLQLKTLHKEIYKNFSYVLYKNQNPFSQIDSGWVIYDFVDIMLHVFLKEIRSYYNLEKLWADAPIIYSSEIKQFRW